MNLVRTALPFSLMALLACGGDDSKQAKAPQTTAGETPSSSYYGSGTGTSGSTMSGTGTSGMTGSPSGSMTGTGTETSTGGSMTGDTSGTGSSVGSTGGPMGSTSGSSGSASTTTFTDAEIAAVVASVNTGEVEEGKAAQKKAKDPKVKAFATKMVNHHTTANTKQADLLKKLKMSTSENATSRDLASEGASALQSLNAQSGADFDRAYIDAQVKDHQKALSLLDDKLIPQAKNADLKQLLQNLRSSVDSHLREAMDIQKSFATK